MLWITMKNFFGGTICLTLKNNEYTVKDVANVVLSNGN